jgi:hypothetical protein
MSARRMAVDGYAGVGGIVGRIFGGRAAANVL